MVVMADLTRQDVIKLARLSRLKLSDDEVEAFQKELSEILGYVEMLESVDTSGLKPTYQVTGLKNVMRKDELITYEATPQELLKNVPARHGDYVKTKRMIA